MQKEMVFSRAAKRVRMEKAGSKKISFEKSLIRKRAWFEKSLVRKELGSKRAWFEKSLVRTGVWVPHISLFFARCGSTAKPKVKCSSRAYLDNNSETGR
jgi:hypothetical protein